MSETPPPYNGTKVEWDEIEDAVREMFDVWIGGDEWEWAKRAWEILGESGLTGYNGAIEQTGVLIRLLTLALIYREWCWLAREESCHEGVMYYLAVDCIGINPFRVAQLMDRDFAADDLLSDQDELLEQALDTRINWERPFIHEALVKGFGGEVPLHLSLRATTGENVPDEAEIDCEDAAAFSWIMEGMHEL